MELDSLHCISQIEIYRQNTEEAAPLFNWGAIQPPLDSIGPQFFTKSALEGDTANHNHAT